MSLLIDLIVRNNYRFLYLGLLAISIIALLVAYFAEYILHYAPCPLCIYERFPYLTLIKLSITALIIQKISKYNLILVFLTLICSCILSAYHSGIERGVFKPSVVCSSMIHIPKTFTIHHIREMLYNQPTTTCSKAAFKILGLSMTEYNLLLNLVMVVVLIIISLDHKRKNSTV